MTVTEFRSAAPYAGAIIAPSAGGGCPIPVNSVLIVDDTTANLLAFSAILKQLPCRIVLAASGREALHCALAEDFSLILMDVRMPEMNGFETAELIRKRERTRNTPILFLSAFEAPALHLFASFIGGRIDFLSSPVDAETLLRKVSSYLQAEAPESQQGSDPRLQKTGEASGNVAAGPA